VSGKLKILVAHNAYQQRGGEDSVVDAELDLLRAYGHEVELFRRHNDELKAMPGLKAALNTVWSRSSANLISETIRMFRPDLVHFHNTFPLISPAAYWVVRDAGLPVVQTLHNFRLHCPQAMYLRDGKVCEDCLGHLPWRSVLHGCYRKSRAQSAVLSSMLVWHRAIGTYRDKVTRYIALNEFCRCKFVAAGLPADRVAIKPNFVEAAVPRDLNRNGFLFAGRLSAEKGLDVLAKAIDLAPTTETSIAGDGPDADQFNGLVGARLLGRLSSEALRQKMNESVALIVPSIWYETFGMVVLEAFSVATPVIASRIGVLPSLVKDGETGLLFEPGNSRELADKMRWALANQNKMKEMGHNARALFEAEYSAGSNYQRLIAIYTDAIHEVACDRPN